MQFFLFLLQFLLLLFSVLEFIFEAKHCIFLSCLSCAEFQRRIHRRCRVRAHCTELSRYRLPARLASARHRSIPSLLLLLLKLLLEVVHGIIVVILLFASLDVLQFIHSLFGFHPFRLTPVHLPCIPYSAHLIPTLVQIRESLHNPVRVLFQNTINEQLLLCVQGFPKLARYQCDTPRTTFNVQSFGMEIILLLSPLFLSPPVHATPLFLSPPVHATSWVS